MRAVTVAAVLFISSLTQAGAPSSSPQLIEKGKTSYTTNCVACHGPKGAGDGVAAAALNPKPRDFTKEAFKNGDNAEAVFKTVSQGLTGTPMVAFAHLSDEERWGLAYYVVELRHAGMPAAPAAATKAAKKVGKK
ncbi:MAG: cytochrome c [Myxococcaceae bacterium]|nr:cytochrome c [Myxococcaceae bacterium]